MQDKIYTDTGHDDISEDSTFRFRPYEISYVWRKVDPEIKISRQKVKRYLAPVIRNYVDMATGEIIDSSLLRNHPDICPTLYVGERCLQRHSILMSLRIEVRAFALFVLRFANNRRGITPGIDGLVEKYAELHDKRPSNVRRYVKPLIDSGVLLGTSLLGPLFQRTGGGMPSKVHQSEEAVAALMYLQMLLKKQSQLADPAHLLAA